MDTEQPPSFCGVNPCLARRLATRGIHAPTRIQALCVPRILAGESLAFRSATGTGKTYAYLLPLLHQLAGEDPGGRRGFPSVLIVSPTIELAAQIKAEADFLSAELPVQAVLCAGGGNVEHQIRSLKKERPHIVVGNVSRILQLRYAGRLRLNAVRTLVLDEADRLMVREQRDETSELLAALPFSRQNIALSATLDRGGLAALEELCRREFGFEETDENEALQRQIEHWALWCCRRDGIATLRSLLAAARFEKALVFAGDSGEIREITAKLRHHKRKVECLYSGQDKKERRTALENFRRGEKNGGVDILVSSDLAARGLDIAGISHVVTLGVNEDAAVYTHRAGRAGRAGKRGICVSIGDEADMRRLQSIE
ncbi:MAG: DEAD/DEAH box helicase, partial [Spirochaetaceae bacterium]|nr:DEAD/DEAH box helicase [Spirochaetaceae bacterium]